MNKTKAIDIYFNSSRLSQSKLLKYRYHPRVIKALQEREKQENKKLYYQEKEGFLKGSLLDVLLLTPDYFKELYYVDDLSDKPNDVVMSILKEAYDLNISIQDREIVEFARTKGYSGNNWSDDVIYKRLLDGGTVGKTIKKNLGLNYYNSLQKAKDKQVISKAEYELATKAVNSLKNNPNTKWLFEQVYPELIIKYQTPIYFDYTISSSQEGGSRKKYEGKSLLDILVINPTEKIINPVEGVTILPFSLTEVDLKSSGEYLYKFMDSIKRWRYDIQRAWYQMSLFHEREWYEREYGAKFTVNNPYILACSFLEPDYPKFFEFTETVIYEAVVGYQKEDYRVYGINDLIERMEYFEKNGYEYDIDEVPTINLKSLWE